MAGYSGKPLVQKLGIKPGFRIFAAGAPAAYGDIVGQLPADVTMAATAKPPLDMVHVFVDQGSRARRQAAQLSRRDRAGRHDLGVVAEEVLRGRTDLTDVVVREPRCRLVSSISRSARSTISGPG